MEDASCQTKYQHTKPLIEPCYRLVIADKADSFLLHICTILLAMKKEPHPLDPATFNQYHQKYTNCCQYQAQLQAECEGLLNAKHSENNQAWEKVNLLPRQIQILKSKLDALPVLEDNHAQDIQMQEKEPLPPVQTEVLKKNPDDMPVINNRTHIFLSPLPYSTGLFSGRSHRTDS